MSMSSSPPFPEVGGSPFEVIEYSGLDELKTEDSAELVGKPQEDNNQQEIDRNAGNDKKEMPEATEKSEEEKFPEQPDKEEVTEQPEKEDIIAAQSEMDQVTVQPKTEEVTAEQSEMDEVSGQPDKEEDATAQSEKGEMTGQPEREEVTSNQSELEEVSGQPKKGVVAEQPEKEEVTADQSDMDVVYGQPEKEEDATEQSEKGEDATEQSEKGEVTGQPEKEEITDHLVQEVEEGENDDNLPPLSATKAMTNEAIITHLFNVCPKEYMGNFRLVSRTWASASYKAWRKRAEVTILSRHGSSEKSKTRVRLNDFLVHVEDPDDPMKLNVSKAFHYNHYNFEKWLMKEGNPYLTKFWNLLGASVHHLNLTRVKLQPRYLLLKILCLAPNLHSLVLDTISEGRDPIPQRLQLDYESYAVQRKLKVLKIRNAQIDSSAFWQIFLARVPNIETFEYVNITADSTLKTILQAMVSIRNRDVLTSSFRVTSLRIIRADARHNCVKPTATLRNVLERLKDLDFPVEELELKLGCKTSVGTVKNILLLYKDTLKVLRFHLDYKNKSKFPHGIKLPLLEEFSLGYYCNRRNITSLNGIVKAIPNLKLLKIHGINGKSFFSNEKDDKEDALPEEAPAESAQKVTSFSDQVRNLNPLQFCNLVKLIPNITKLELRVNNEIFRLVCKHFPLLVELRLCGAASLTDSAITGKGISAGEPKLTDLKNLQLLAIRCRSHSLTSTSIFGGILELKQLQTLEMALPEAQISKEARNALEKAILVLIVLKAEVATKD